MICDTINQFVLQSRTMNTIIILSLAFFSSVSGLNIHHRNKAIERYVPETDVQFQLYTRDNPGIAEYQLIEYGNETSLKSSFFRLDKPLKIFTHGKGGNPVGAPTVPHADAFLANADCNVINVDWSKGAMGSEDSVIAATAPTGTFVGKFIDWLTTFGVKTSNIHIFGMSIGSHVAGYAARTTTKGQIPYLTACDPPRNYWETADDHVKKGDAAYVEVIHTNTATTSIRAPIGDVDFYPNWGVSQPGCTGSSAQANLCSHIRALDYFVYSIDNQYFLGSQCTGYEEIVNQTCSNIGKLHLGGVQPKKASGVYYLETTGTPPFYIINSTQTESF